MTSSIVLKDGSLVHSDEWNGVPSDRHFRGAWTLNDSDVVVEDLAAAKNIFKDKIRDVRTALLEAQDIAYMKALEADDSSAKTAAVNKKTALRDAPAAAAITNATTIDELKAAWDSDVLGTSPYA
jgi:hypothetical protein